MTAGADFADFDKLDKLLRTIPQRTAARLQRALKANAFDHVKAVRQRSGYSAESNRRMAASIRVKPEVFDSKRVKLGDVFLEEFTRWGLGRERDADRAAAARIEKRVGMTVAKPTSRRFLAIPAGSLRTTQGRVKRKAGKQVEVRNVKDTKLVKLKDGRLLVVKVRNKGRRRSMREMRQDKQSGTQRKRLEVVGVLVRGAWVNRGLDYFGSWDSLRNARDRRYDRLLADVIAGKA